VVNKLPSEHSRQITRQDEKEEIGKDKAKLRPNRHGDDPRIPKEVLGKATSHELHFILQLQVKSGTKSKLSKCSDKRRQL
jgi:hypothetical protein